MASSPSTLLLLELMADGENSNTWGQKTNANLSLVENAISKRQALTLGGVDVTLTDTQYADNQARSLCLALSGTVSANINVIVPSRSKMYLIDNATSGAFTVTVKTAAGSGVVCTQGKITLIYVDGTNAKPVIVSGALDADTVDGIDGASFARKDAFNQFTKGRANTMVALSDAGTIDVDASLGEFFRVVIAGNRTFTFSNIGNGSYVELYVVQDGTGGRTVTWPSNVVWKNGASPVLSTGANATDKIVLRYNSAASIWYGESAAGFGGGSSSAISDITISGSGSNVDVFALAGSPGSAVTFSITIATGVLITSHSPTSPALDFNGFASGSVISLINHGKIVGKGGRGGSGSNFADVSDSQTNAEVGRPGQAGGTALRGPGSGRTFSITNADGFIFGGGGGGGGGGCSADGGSAGNIAAGGGGGGGAGFGAAGDGNSMVTSSGSALGTDGTDGSLTAAGTGGAGAQAGTATGGAGGAGGGFGAAGTAGTAPTAQGNDIGAGAAGAAGGAVDLNSGSVTFVSGNDGTHVKGAVA